MIIRHPRYLDQYGYIYGVQNRINSLITKYSQVYYSISEIDILYTVIEIEKQYNNKDIGSLYSVIEIQALYSTTLM